MPYSTSSELPQSVRNAIPSANGKEMFRNVVNNQLKAGKSESVAFASAWAALQRAGYNKEEGQWIRKSRDTGLQNKMKEHNENAADGRKVTMNMLREVYDRGVGAYKTNPGSVRPNVKSPEQWAMARVNSFLKIVNGSKTANHDKDLLPAGHPSKSDKVEKQRAFMSRESAEEASMELGLEGRTHSHETDSGTVYMPGANMEEYTSAIKKTEPTNDSVHVPSTDWKRKPKQVGKAEGYLPPQAARNNAKRAIAWKEEHGDAVKGGTQVGWTRAHQLSSGERLSLSTVKRMAQFNRHRKNAVVAPEYKSEPWKDAGHVAWLLWGGTTGVDWAKGIAERVQKRQVTDDLFTDKLGAMARSVDIGLDGEVHVVIVDGQLYYRPGDDEEDYVEALWDGPEEEEETDDDESNGDLLDTAIRAILGAVMEKSSDISSSVNIIKADDEQRIVWGWASVATENGEPVFDIHGDHIPMEELTKASVDFMRNYRVGKTEHFGKQTSEVIAMLPLSKSLAEALGIQTNREGLVVGFKVHDDETWNGIKSGDLPAFSIGGRGELHAAE